MRLIQWTQEYFRKKDIDSPRLSAEVLLASVLGYDRVKLYTKFDEEVAADSLASFKKLVLERARGVPLKYLVGHCEFMSIDFIVTPAVLIPRPETELLVEKALELAGAVADPKIADIGTGCGNIAISLAANSPRAALWATDISPEALEIARKNAARIGVSDRITFLLGDLYRPLLEAGLGGQLDVVCSNPPYVSDGQWDRLSAEIRDHEPEIALKAGPDGLKYLNPLIEGAPELLTPGGWLLLEIGDDQAAAVRGAVAQRGGLEDCVIYRDYRGRDRLLAAKKA